MRFRENREEIIRRIIFLFLIVFTAILQNTEGLFPKIHNSSPMLLIPLTVCIAMFETDMGGLFSGLAAGLAWDVVCASGDGFYPVIFVAAGYVTAYLSARYLRKNFVTATVLTMLLSVICVGLYRLFFVVFTEFPEGFYLFAVKHIISILYTVALTPLYYYFISRTVLSLKKETDGE